MTKTKSLKLKCPSCNKLVDAYLPHYCKTRGGGFKIKWQKWDVLYVVQLRLQEITVRINVENVEWE